jgi:hypothetical protein
MTLSHRMRMNLSGNALSPKNENALASGNSQSYPNTLQDNNNISSENTNNSLPNEKEPPHCSFYCTNDNMYFHRISYLSSHLSTHPMTLSHRMNNKTLLSNLPKVSNLRKDLHTWFLLFYNFTSSLTTKSNLDLM